MAHPTDFAAATWSSSRPEAKALQTQGSSALAEEGAYLLYSITKTFIAALVLKAAQQGAFDLDASAASVLDETRLPRPITLRHLLGHTSGLGDYGGLQEYHQDVRLRPSTPWPAAEFIGRALGQPLLFAPGQGWAYSNPGYLLLKAALEKVHGLPLREIVAKEICEPLGLVGTGVAMEPQDLLRLVPGHSRLVAATGAAADVRGLYHPGWVAHGVIASSATELVRFALALFREEIVDARSLKQMMALTPVPGTHPPWRAPAYGLGLMGDMDFPGGPVFGHSGEGPGFSASVFVRLHDREVRFVACALCAGETKSAQELALQELASQA